MLKKSVTVAREIKAKRANHGVDRIVSAPSFVALMCAGFLPFLKIRLLVTVPLLLFWIAFPWLIRLLVGAPVRPLSRIGFGVSLLMNFTST
jgi:hypothetical protein